MCGQNKRPATKCRVQYLLRNQSSNNGYYSSVIHMSSCALIICITSARVKKGIAHTREINTLCFSRKADTVAWNLLNFNQKKYKLIEYKNTQMGFKWRNLMLKDGLLKTSYILSMGGWVGGGGIQASKCFWEQNIVSDIC